MKLTLSNQEISKVIGSFELLDDKTLENLSNRLSNNQPYLTALIEASYEIFEDEEDYMEELDYHFLLIDYLYSKTIGETETIMPEFLEKKDDEHIKLIDKISESDSFDEELITIFENHPRTDLIMFFYEDLFDDEMDFDDQSLELTTQLMLMIFFIIDVYHNSTIKNDEA